MPSGRLGQADTRAPDIFHVAQLRFDETTFKHVHVKASEKPILGCVVDRCHNTTGWNEVVQFSQISRRKLPILHLSCAWESHFSRGPE